MRLRLSGHALLPLLLLAPTVHAQSTDGFHASQVIPVVVDTASYTTRLSFTNGVNAPRSVHAWYLPAEGTSQASELDCGTFTMAAAQVKTFCEPSRRVPSIARR